MTDEPEEVIVVCAQITTPLYMPDNRIGKCIECGWKVQYRPNAPKGRKLCMKCAADLVEPDAKMSIPPSVLEDLQTYYRKKRH